MEQKFDKPIGEKSWEQKLNKSLTEKSCLRFKTRDSEGKVYEGIVTHSTSTFVIFNHVIDFELDGFVVLPKSYIRSVRDSSFEQCANEILLYNGQIKKQHIPAWLADCKTIKDVIAKLQEQDIWPSVETFVNRKKETALYLGPITQVEETSFFLNCYDAAGKWEKNYQLYYGAIYRICINGKYETNFNAYMRRAAPPS
jgi:hypothetical protein